MGNTAAHLWMMSQRKENIMTWTDVHNCFSIFIVTSAVIFLRHMCQWQLYLFYSGVCSSLFAFKSCVGPFIHSIWCHFVCFPVYFLFLHSLWYVCVSLFDGCLPFFCLFSNIFSFPYFHLLLSHLLYCMYFLHCPVSAFTMPSLFS